MDAASPRWREITVSEYPWERDALAFVRGRLPDIEPYQVWTNFEFIADDGSLNEVDLLALTPKGFHLVEIKSAPGVVEGDRGVWTWRREKRVRTVDNPLLLANRKAKKLIALLRRQPAMRSVPSPFLEARVFLSHESVDCRLPEELRGRVHLRDAGAGRAERPGIVAALTRGAPPAGRRRAPLARALRRAMEEAGVRRSQRSRQVGDYRLDELLLEGPGYQDWTAHHVAVESERARVRIYGAPRGVSDEERAALARAAEREYRILQDVRHEGILAAKAFTGHPLGPALVFAHRDGAERFDHWLAARAERLDVDVRIHLLRQIAEALRHAHARRLVHRALSPQSLLVLDPDAALPRVQVFNWQTGARGAGTAGAVTSGATRLGTLVEDAAWIYLAPEAVTGHGAPAEQSDVFSLGALACHLFSGRAPASSPIEMNERLRREQGLRISSVLDGAGESLQRLVQDATHPDVSLRLASVADFLAGLEAVEDELTAPEVRSRPDPLEARPGDELDHGLTVKRRLGRGSTALALLVERGGREQVLKVALSSEDNGRLEAEAEVLRRLRHQSVVELHDVLRFGDRVGLLMARAGRETLADRLREEGSLHLELLERFGEDLLAAVDWLEQQGVPHRDVKPENLGVAKVGSRLHLVLFDFSLARTPADNVRAGTRPYLDPFLAARRPPRWDTHAERFAAAVTLHEMAAGSLPRWGDGRSEPAVLDCEATVDADAFEPAVREGLTAFFGRALRREFGKRFDNAQEMLRAWRQVFLAASRPETVPDPPPAAVPDPPPAVGAGGAALDTLLAEIGLSARGLALRPPSSATAVDTPPAVSIPAPATDAGSGDVSPDAGEPRAASQDGPKIEDVGNVGKASHRKSNTAIGYPKTSTTDNERPAAVWVVRAKRGSLSYTEHFVANGYAGIGTVDVSSAKDRDEIRRLCEQAHPDWNAGLIRNYTGQYYNFLFRIREGDYVLTPELDVGRLRYGRVVGPGESAAGDDGCPYRNRRAVDWNPASFARVRLSESLRKTLRQRTTVFPVPQREEFLAAVGLSAAAPHGDWFHARQRRVLLKRAIASGGRSPTFDAGRHEEGRRPDVDLPYDMGNAGDLLKHGVLAEFVRWQCESKVAFRFLDPFGGEPWSAPRAEVARRVRSLPEECALRSAQSEIDHGRYYGSGLVVRRVADACGRAGVRVLVSDQDPAKRKRLQECGLGGLQMLADDFPGRGASGYDGYAAFSEIVRGAKGGDLVLLDPYDRFLPDEAPAVVPRMAEMAGRAAVLLFALNLNPNNPVGRRFDDLLADHVPGAWRMTCPPLRGAGVKGESKYHAEVILAARAFRDDARERGVDTLWKRLREFSRHLAAALDLPEDALVPRKVRRGEPTP